MVVHCTQFILGEDLPKLRKEFRSEFFMPSFRDWYCETPDLSFQCDYIDWAERWYLIDDEPECWRLVHGRHGDSERWVTMGFIVSDRDEEYYAEYTPDSPSLRVREIAHFGGLLRSFTRTLSANGITDDEGQQIDLIENWRNQDQQEENGPDEHGYDDEEDFDNDCESFYPCMRISTLEVEEGTVGQ